MCLDQFFGQLSPFQIIVSAVALITGAYTFYKSFLERSKIFLYLGDAVRIVLDPDGSASKLNLLCNLINKSTKVGTVHRLEVQVTDQQGVTIRFIWNLFYKYLAGGQEVLKESDIYPISIFQKDSKLLFVGFQAEYDNSITWSEGRYKIQVHGWVNRHDRHQSCNLESVYHIEITKNIVDQLSKPVTKQPIWFTIPILEWERQHR